LQLVLREMLINDSVNQTLGGTPFDELLDVSKTVKYTAVMVSTIPVLLIYPFLQKYFVKGVLIGGIKG
jgi:putative aldouronate transport system permease protein